ncbi:MAG TPA: hypothetical protein VEA59_06210 [Patescibacteria group bacterium]|nr:hypothetical protein [Patescibacteria group bacterium]
MLTTADIKKLSSYLKEDFKDVFATKDDLKRLETKLDAKIDTLTIAADSFTKEISDNRTERTIIAHT